jgi:hypothetical protein
MSTCEIYSKKKPSKQVTTKERKQKAIKQSDQAKQTKEVRLSDF